MLEGEKIYGKIINGLVQALTSITKEKGGD